MAVRKKEDLLSAIGAKLEGGDDDTLALLEDITDTFDAFNESEDWHTRYDELDKTWREKYRARFFEGASDDDESEEEKPKPRKFEELFKTL